MHPLKQSKHELQKGKTINPRRGTSKADDSHEQEPDDSMDLQNPSNTQRILSSRSFKLRNPIKKPSTPQGPTPPQRPSTAPGAYGHARTRSQGRGRRTMLCDTSTRLTVRSTRHGAPAPDHLGKGRRSFCAEPEKLSGSREMRIRWVAGGRHQSVSELRPPK